MKNFFGLKVLVSLVVLYCGSAKAAEHPLCGDGYSWIESLSINPIESASKYPHGYKEVRLQQLIENPEKLGIELGQAIGFMMGSREIIIRCGDEFLFIYQISDASRKSQEIKTISYVEQYTLEMLNEFYAGILEKSDISLDWNNFSMPVFLPKV